MENSPVKSPNTIIDELVEIVSKRGVLMLSFAPRPDGTFPEDQKQLMFSIGDWLKVCGEAIYNTRPWMAFGEGPSVVNPQSKIYTSEDIRFTRNKEKTILYAILMDWPNDHIIIKSLGPKVVDENSIKSISIIGLDEKIKWSQDADGLIINKPEKRPLYDYAYPVNVGNPDEISLLDFAEEIIKLTGTTQKIIFKPLPTDDPKQRQPDITKAKELLGWQPRVARAEGLKITYDYFKSLPKDELYKLPKEFENKK